MWSQNMPELPEVETTMRCMRSEFLGYKISSVKFFRKDLRDPMPIRRIKAVGVGAKIEDFERRGKYILMHAGAHSIVLHLGMTGNVLARGEAKPSQKHTHFVWEMLEKVAKRKSTYTTSTPAGLAGLIFCRVIAGKNMRIFLRWAPSR
jgi:formamidopyrimidine-DNA glycosylase